MKNILDKLVVSIVAVVVIILIVFLFINLVANIKYLVNLNTANTACNIKHVVLDNYKPVLVEETKLLQVYPNTRYKVCNCALVDTKACENCSSEYTYSEYKFPTIQQAVQIAMQTNNAEKKLENTFEIVKNTKRK